MTSMLLQDNHTSVKTIVISCMAIYRPGHILGPCPKGNEAKGSNLSVFESLNHRCGKYSNGALKYSSFLDVKELNDIINI